MIFFTLGTERFPFRRLVEAAELAVDAFAGEEVFVQVGHHPEPPRNCAWAQFLPFPELVARVRSARVVVSHAGAGTILTCNALGKIPIVLVREFRRGEHFDDHQAQLARRMNQLGRIVLVPTPEATVEAIRKHARDRKADVGSGDVPELARAVTRYLDAISDRPDRRVPADWTPWPKPTGPGTTTADG